jgi:hypothetical protein
MALVVKDRVKETSTTTGTGTFTLAGAVTGFQAFSVIGNANTTYYAIVEQSGSEWEVGIGTYTSSGTTLSRDTVLESSNSNSLVNFSAGTKDVFVTYSADRAVYGSASGVIEFTGASSNISSLFSNALEKVTITGTGAGGTINYDVTNQSVLDYSVAASSNFTVNFRGNSTVQLNAIMGIGQCITLTLITVQGGTAFYNTSISIDTSLVVTREWQNGVIPAGGNANSDDIYTYTILKTAASAFTVYATQTRYA